MTIAVVPGFSVPMSFSCLLFYHSIISSCFFPPRFVFTAALVLTVSVRPMSFAIVHRVSRTFVTLSLAVSALVLAVCLACMLPVFPRLSHFSHTRRYGSALEVEASGMLRARFAEDGKLEELDIMFDGVAVHQQIQKATGVRLFFFAR